MRSRVAKQKKIPSPLKQLHLSGPVTEALGTCQQYRQYNDGQIFISCSKGNNCFSVGGRILIVRNILLSSEAVKVLCHFFENYQSFFHLPNWLCMPWNSLSFKLIQRLGCCISWGIKEKMFLLPFKICGISTAALACLFYIFPACYHLPLFLDGGGVAIVPRKWFTGPEEDSCLWPPGWVNITKAVKEGLVPSADWLQYMVEVLGKAGNVTLFEWW